MQRRALPRFEDAISHDGVSAGFVLQNRLRSAFRRLRFAVLGSVRFRTFVFLSVSPVGSCHNFRFLRVKDTGDGR
jgi:hypothetical protein